LKPLSEIGGFSTHPRLGLLVPPGVITHRQSTARATFPCQPIIIRFAPLPVIPTLWAFDVWLGKYHASEHDTDEENSSPESENATEHYFVAIYGLLDKPCSNPDDNASDKTKPKRPSRSATPSEMCLFKTHDFGAE
jgi:hypothetical protein